MRGVMPSSSDFGLVFDVFDVSGRGLRAILAFGGRSAQQRAGPHAPHWRPWLWGAGADKKFQAR
jgi:hypothetical protein